MTRKGTAGDFTMTVRGVAVLNVFLRCPSLSRYGLEISKETGVATARVTGILRTMVRLGWAECELERFQEAKGGWPPQRKYYKLTPKGVVEAQRLTGSAKRLLGVG